MKANYLASTLICFVAGTLTGVSGSRFFNGESANPSPASTPVAVSATHTPICDCDQLAGNPLAPSIVQDALSSTQPQSSDSMDLLIPELMQVSESTSLAAQSRELELAMSGGREEDRYYRVSSILVEWAQIDPTAAMDWLRQHDTAEFPTEFITPFFYTWIEADPEAALLEIDLLPESWEKSALLASYASTVARSDPERAYYWADSLVDSRASHQAKGGVLQEWGMADPEALKLFIDGVSDDAERQLLLDSAAPLLGSVGGPLDPIARLAWADTLHPAQRMDVRRAAIFEWMETAPGDALYWVQSNANEAEAEELTYMVASSLPQYDLELAKTLFDTSDTDIRQAMSYGLMDVMYRDNPADAKMWLRSFPEDELRADLSRNLASMMAYEYPEDALQMVLSFESESRQSMLHELASMIGSFDPTLISQWAEVADLTEQEREALAPVVREAQLYPVYGSGH